VDYEDIDVGADAALRAEMERRAGRRTVPQIWVGNRHIGGFDDMTSCTARDCSNRCLPQRAAMNEE
jgi:glutaredoxin